MVRVLVLGCWTATRSVRYCPGTREEGGCGKVAMLSSVVLAVVVAVVVVFFSLLRLSACRLMMAMPGERTGDLLFFFRPEEGTGLDF